MKLTLFILLSVFIDSLHPAQDAEFLPPETNGFNNINLQQTETATISGKISDSKGNALMYASVFISNTTFGTITNENGEFRLNNVPFGQHVLVASYVGFSFKKISINVNRASLTQNLQLKKHTLKIDEVEIQTSKSKNKWKQNFKEFEKNFIGKSDNAPSCKIINPKALIFHYDKESGALTAKARETLVIENYGLGYTIHFVLEKFELQRGGTCTYLGSAHFIPMKAENTAIAESWKINRKHAYIGSVQHFLRALTKNSLVEEGFVVQSGSSMYPVENEKELDYMLKRHPNPLNSEIHIYPGRYYYERRFWFNNILHVAFTKETEGYAYGTTRDPKYRLKTFQQSWIRLQKKDALFNTLGYLNDPNSIIFYGYWAFERQSEALPEDYYPRD